MIIYAMFHQSPYHFAAIVRYSFDETPHYDICLITLDRLTGSLIERLTCDGAYLKYRENSLSCLYWKV